MSWDAHLLISLLFLIMVLTQVIFIIIVLILEVTRFKIIFELLPLEGIASKPVDSAGNQLLLDIFTQLVIEL